MGLHDRDWYHEAIDEKNGKKRVNVSEGPSQAELMKIQRDLSKLNYFKPKPVRNPLWKLMLKTMAVFTILIAIINMLIKLKTG